MTPAPAPLRLIAHDADDLSVISTLLQDALVRHGDMTFDRRRRRFVLAVSRFRWEAGKARERVRTGLHFNHVMGVQHQGLALDKPDTVAELLAVRTGPAADGGVALTLDFAGGGTIRLDAECVDAELRDLGDSWPARRVPDHSAAD